MTHLNGNDRTVGVSQSKSNVWVSASRDWNAFLSFVGEVLRSIRTSAAPNTQPVYELPFLAQPFATQQSLGRPFEINLVPPELIGTGGAGADQALLDLAEKWGRGCSFDDIRALSQINFTARATLDGDILGRLRFDVVGNPDRRIEVSGDRDPGANVEDWDELLQVCRNTQWLKIRFEKGTTLSEGAFYKMHFRDFPFKTWRWESFLNFDVTKEKPIVGTNKRSFSIADIGLQNSLFCWVQQNWFGLPLLNSTSGHLICDDGAGEVGDFVHIDTAALDNDLPWVTLIHVKASSSNAAHRRVSVTDFEVVCAQAVKNLRALELSHLTTSLQRSMGNQVAAASWQNGNHVGSRTPAMAWAQAHGSNYRRRVVIVQPRMTTTTQAQMNLQVAQHNQGKYPQIMRQLNTLLLDTEASCRSLGAEFLVIGAS